VPSVDKGFRIYWCVPKKYGKFLTSTGSQLCRNLGDTPNPDAEICTMAMKNLINSLVYSSPKELRYSSI